MLKEAHHHSANRSAGRIGGRIALASLCLLAFVLLLCAEASATQPVTGALGAVAQTTPQQLSSTASSAVGQVAKATPALPSPSPAEQPVAAVRQAVAASAIASTPAGPPPTTTALHETGVGAVVREARERIAPTSGVASNAGGGTLRAIDAGGGALRAIVHSASAGTSGLPVSAPVTAIVNRASSSPVLGVARAVTHSVTHATSATQIVQTLTGATSALTTAIPRATIPRATRPGGALEGPSGAPRARRTPTPLRTIERVAGEHQLATAQQQTLIAAGGPASIAQSAAGRPLITATPLVQDNFGSWIGRARATSAGPWPSTPASETGLPVRAFVSGQSAASSPARGAHRAPLPASPTPTPSPGGVSPPAAVGAGTGVSVASLFAALLMLAAPLARRRLRLDGESWRTSPFMLIADRPG